MSLLFVFHSFSDLANSNPVQVCVGLNEKLHSLWCSYVPLFSYGRPM